MNFTENYDMFLGEDHELLRKTVRDFAEKEVALSIREWDRSGAQADQGPETRTHIRPLLARMGELGLLGVPVFIFLEGPRGRGRARVQRDCSADARRLLPFRRWLGPATPGVIGGGRGVCDGRAKGPARLQRGEE